MSKKILFTALTLVFLCALSTAQTQSPLQLAWSILDAGLGNTAYQQRVSAVTALALIPADPKATTMAEHALKDQNAYVRQAAATTLGTLKATSSISALQEALKDSSPAVIMAAAQSLVEMKNEDGYDTYYAVATGTMKSGQGLVASEQAKLNQLLHNPKDLAETAFEQGIGFVPFGGLGFGAFKAIHDSGANATLVKATALKMLAHDPDPRSGKALIAATGDSQWVIRAAAYDSLAQRGDRSLVSQMALGLTDQQEQVKLTAAAAIAQLSALR